MTPLLLNKSLQTQTLIQLGASVAYSLLAATVAALFGYDRNGEDDV